MLLLNHSVIFDSFATPWTVAHQAPLSVEFSRQEHWSGLPFPTPRDPPHSGTEVLSPVLQEDSLPLNQLFPDGSVGKEFACSAEHTGDRGSILRSGGFPGEGNGNPRSLVMWPGKSYAQKSLVSYSPWGHKELNTTEQLTLLYH